MEFISYFIYKFVDIQGSLLYVGKTTNLRRRVLQHLNDKSWADEIFSLYYAECESATQMDIYELYTIGKEKPKYNLDCSHDDSPFEETLKPLQFKHRFLIDFLGESDNKVKTPMQIFEERQKNNFRF